MQTRRALAFSFLDRYAGLVMAIVSSMVIARLLTPAEIGVHSVTMVLVMFAMSLRDLGAGQYLVKEKNLTPEQIGAIWTVLLGAGLLLGIVVALAAAPVSKFYAEPRIFDIMLVIALNFCINPFGSMTYAWLIREMRFDKLAVMRFSSTFTGSCVSVWLAWRGWGPISLALGTLIGTAVNAAVAIKFRPAHFSWRPSFRGLREVAGYGGQISATSLIWNVASGAPELLLGKIQGLAAAGLYSRGHGLAQMFSRLVIDAAQAVAMPAFAKHMRDHGSIEAPFLRGLAYATALGWSFFLGLLMLAQPAIRVLYGDQWDDSVPVARLLAIAMMIGLVDCLCPAVLMGTGHARRYLVVTAIVVPIYVGCVVAGSIFGLIGVGIGIVVAQFLMLPIWLMSVQSIVEFRWSALIRLLVSSGIVAVAAAAPALVLIIAFGLAPQSALLILVASFLGGTATFVVAARLVAHPIHEEVERLWLHVKARLL